MLKKKTLGTYRKAEGEEEERELEVGRGWGEEGSNIDRNRFLLVRLERL